jgi:aldehyde:ferredoxin oxidoreductase
MAEGIRRAAEVLAHDEFRAMVKDMVAHGFKIDPALAARYSAAERIIDAIDAYQQAVQKADAVSSVTDVHGHPVSSEEWSEADKRWAWGDR